MALRFFDLSQYQPTRISNGDTALRDLIDQLDGCDLHQAKHYNIHLITAREIQQEHTTGVQPLHSLRFLSYLAQQVTEDPRDVLGSEEFICTPDPSKPLGSSIKKMLRKWEKGYRCRQCNLVPEKRQSCGRCGALYCGRLCQEAHWPKHKATCKQEAQKKKATCKQEAQNKATPTASASYVHIIQFP